ncbi:MAG: alanine racemase [Clostridia bacterium]|nr:alanine racemase [Clostridia bacterium]
MAVITVKTSDLLENYEKLKKTLGDTALLAFVKGNGYGFGTEWMVRTLHQAGQRIFCTARAEEALLIRSLLPDASVWLCSVYDDAQTLRNIIQNGVIPTVDSIRGLQQLDELYGELPVRCHVSIDTGMGRNGVRSEELDDFIQACKLCDRLSIVSVFTHFANCYGGRKGEKATMAQNAAFVAALERFSAAEVPTGMHHCCNSAAALLYPGLRMDAVRVGSGLLGRCVGAKKAGLVSVGTLTAKVTSLHRLPKGAALGYGSVWKARRETTVAMVDAGHCDGVFLNRSADGFRLSDRLYALKRALTARPLTATVNGKRYRVIGRVGMTDLALADPKGRLSVGDAVCFDVNPVLAGAKEVVHE